MDDFSERLGKVEVGVAEIRARIPYLATSADMHAMETRLVSAISSVHTELVSAIGSVRAELGAVRTELIKWLVGTLLSSVAAAAAVAKFFS